MNQCSSCKRQIGPDEVYYKKFIRTPLRGSTLIWIQCLECKELEDGIEKMLKEERDGQGQTTR